LVFEEEVAVFCVSHCLTLSPHSGDPDGRVLSTPLRPVGARVLASTRGERGRRAFEREREEVCADVPETPLAGVEGGLGGWVGRVKSLLCVKVSSSSSG
jgi:hypothetical protein